MAHRANKRPPGRIKSSIVARLNTRLFFRLLGIYFTMDLLLLFLFCGGLFVWSEQQAAQISTLVEERGVPSAEATEWMTAGDYTVTAGTPEADGAVLLQAAQGAHPLEIELVQIEIQVGGAACATSTPARWISFCWSPSPPATPPATPSRCRGTSPTPSGWI